MVVLIALFAACLMNEIGVFDVSSLMAWTCFGVAAVAFVLARFLAYNETLSVKPWSKYIILSVAILLTLLVTVFLNINVTMLYLLPMLIATQYRSMKISWFSVISSAMCCIISPVLSWLIGSWSLNILTGYVETTCRVTIERLGGSSLTAGESIFNLLVYLSLPQVMIIAVFGSITLTITHTCIRGMKNRIRAFNLTENLNGELEHVIKMQDQVLSAVAEFIENRDMVTGGHVKRTSEIVKFMVEEMEKDTSLALPATFYSSVIKAAPLHDLGKISVDDAILRKPGKLTAEEFGVIKTHPMKSAEIIDNVLHGLESDDFLKIAINLAMYHHEWYDGSGYPEGKKGKEIPLEARIMAIADVYDALVSKRSYKDAMTDEEAFEIIENLMGRQFDPGLNKYFIAIRSAIRNYYAEE